MDGPGPCLVGDHQCNDDGPYNHGTLSDAQVTTQTIPLELPVQDIEDVYTSKQFSDRHEDKNIVGFVRVKYVVNKQHGKLNNMVEFTFAVTKDA